MSSQTTKTLKQSVHTRKSTSSVRLGAISGPLVLCLAICACGSKSATESAKEQAASPEVTASDTETAPPPLPTTPPPTLTMPGSEPANMPIQSPSSVPLPTALPIQEIGTFERASWLEGAERAISFRLGNKLFIALAGSGWLRIVAPDGTKVAETDGLGSAIALEAVDIDGDGKVELVVGRGQSSKAISAPPGVFIYRFDGSRFQSAESIELPTTIDRSNLVDVVPDPNKKGFLWVAWDTIRADTTLLAATRDAKTRTWKTEVIDTIGNPTALASGDPDGDGKTDLFVARPNGQERNTLGDLFLHRPGALNEFLPITYGAYDMVVHKNQVIVVDGWHYRYGPEARGLVTQLIFENGKWRSQILVNVLNHRSFRRVRLGDVNGDGKLDAIAAGGYGPAILVPSLEPLANFVPVFGTGTKAHKGRTDDVLAVDLDGNGRDEVLVLSSKPGIWRADE